MNETIDILNSVGMETFIEYFDIFKRMPENSVIIEAFSNESWKDSSKSTKASKGKKIFLEYRDRDALDLITRSTRLSPEYIAKAKELLKDYPDEMPVLEFSSGIEKDPKVILAKIWDWADSQGFSFSEISTVMIDKINEEFAPEMEALLIEDEEDLRFEVRITGQSPIDEVEVTPLSGNLKTIDLSKHIIPAGVWKRKNMTLKSDKIKTRFRSRLRTQRRLPKSGLCYLPDVFRRLDVNFPEIIEMQLSKISAFQKCTDDSYSRVKISDFERLYIAEGYLYGQKQLRGVKMELYFECNGAYHSFGPYVCDISDISIDHRKPISRILSDLYEAGKLPTLKMLSGIVISSGLNATSRNDLNRIEELVEQQNISVIELEKELLLIESEVQLDLIPRAVNSSFGMK